MKTLKNYMAGISNSGRLASESTKKEIIDMLDIISQDIIDGKTTLLHANALIAIRQRIMASAERSVDDIISDTELSVMASLMGRKGGSSTSPTKIKSSRENGRLGGRPKKRR